jgi:hypothetical protein
VPPFWIVNAPVAETPTVRSDDCAPAAPITVALGVTVSILALLALVGTPPDQLPALNQSLEAAPVQSTERDGIVDPSIIPRARDVAETPFRNCRASEFAIGTNRFHFREPTWGDSI